MKKKISRHAKISYVKSGLRIIGFYLLLVSGMLGIVTLIAAEVVGIIEEIYE